MTLQSVGTEWPPWHSLSSLTGLKLPAGRDCPLRHDCLVPTTELAGLWGQRDLISGPKEGLPAAQQQLPGLHVGMETPQLPDIVSVKLEFQINKNERIILA